jgi:hypothetical protein
LYIDWHCPQIDCNQLGLCIDEYIIKSIVISLDCILMGINGGLDSGFNGGFDGGIYGGSFHQFHLAMLGYLSTFAKRSMAQTRGFYGYQPRGFNGLVVKRTHCFTGLLQAIIIVT